MTSRSEDFAKANMEEKSEKAKDKKVKITHEMYENLKSELEKSKNEKADLINSLQHLQAEFENFKKRMIKEQTHYLHIAIEEFINKLLPVIDNFERAIYLTEEIKEHQGIFKGLEMVYGELLSLLEREGISEVKTDGKFDPQLHEAVMQVEEEGYDENAIVDVLRKGYIFKGKLIRPAMVKVAKK